MNTIAVTPETSAVPTDTTNSNFLPEGDAYRLKGEMPDKDQSVKEEESATSASETAAASETAETQERRPQQKTERTSESRWAKITRENRELRERVARYESQPPKELQRETQQEAQPAKEAGRTEPKLEDIDEKTGKPKYATLMEFLADQAKWNREEAVREFQEMSAKTERERQQQQTEQVIEKTLTERRAAARKAYTDYDDVMQNAMEAKDELGREAVYFTKGSHIDSFFLDSDRGQDVLYAVVKDLDTHGHIFARDEKGNYLMNPVRQLRELAKIENSLPQNGKVSPAPKITQAPRPPNQVSAKGAVGKDAVDQAVEEMDTETYIKEQNAKALARLKKGK